MKYLVLVHFYGILKMNCMSKEKIMNYFKHPRLFTFTLGLLLSVAITYFLFIDAVIQPELTHAILFFH